MMIPNQPFGGVSAVPPVSESDNTVAALAPLYKWASHAQLIRTELQENMAQSLAAAKLYLDLAERDGDRVLVAKAKGLVDQVIYEMIRLTRQLPPAESSLAVAV